MYGRHFKTRRTLQTTSAFAIDVKCPDREQHLWSQLSDKR